MSNRWLRAMVIAVLAIVFGASTAHAQYPPTRPPTLVISQEIGPPGFTFTATVSNCVPGQRIVFVLGDQRVEATCDPTTLQASASLTAPPGLGTYTVRAEFYGDCSPFGPLPRGIRSTALVAQAEVPCLVLSETIQVVAATSTTTTTTTTVPGSIPTTGSSGLGATMRTALVALVAGFGLFVVARVRRRTA